MKSPKQPSSSLFAFLISLLKAAHEYMRYSRSIRFMRRIHVNNDFIIYCVKKAARETALGQRVSITLEMAGAKMTIAVDTGQESPALAKEDELYQGWKNARHGRGE